MNFFVVFLNAPYAMFDGIDIIDLLYGQLLYVLYTDPPSELHYSLPAFDSRLLANNRPLASRL